VLGETQDTEIPFPGNVGGLVRAREANVMKADLSQYAATRDGLTAQIEEKEATKRRLAMSITARQDLIKSLKERVDVHSELYSAGSHEHRDPRDRVANQAGRRGHHPSRERIAGRYRQLVGGRDRGALSAVGILGAAQGRRRTVVEKYDLDSHCLPRWMEFAERVGSAVS
jgi:hypothetical protein